VSTTTIGLLGAALAALAYVPQIRHLLAERCAAGVSVFAFSAWLIAAAMTLVHAIAIGAQVFIALSAFQIAATGVVLACSVRLRGARCASHGPATPQRAS
jgi:uncharacterized protein with PQ loop repeat